ncbi:MAG: HNH endonuclease [Candidatus Micrarchaeota archaeon]|nr:HNH endonuclease [Candidatus Micrarchaeota archaeon]
MSKLPKEELLEHVLKAIEESGGGYRVIREAHPFVLYVFNREDSERFRIYIWNITHGGGYKRAADEYRIQLTMPERESAIEVTRPFKTLLLGYDPRFKVFAGYNASRYQTAGFSASLQIKEGFLAQAAKEGFAIQPKEVDSSGNVTEVAVAFSPEQFLTYAFNLDAYHQHQIPERELQVIQKAATAALLDSDLTILPEPRRRSVKEFNYAVRDKRFSKYVLQAYGHKCAICKTQLKLVEAAHIVPVKDNGTDEVVNGIALCANHHKAFDDGLILLSVSGQVMLIDKKTTELRRRNLHDGLKEFEVGLNLGRAILMPADPKYRPKQEYISERLRLEGFKLML